MTAAALDPARRQALRRHQGLEDVSFDVHAGEVLALLGDNGAGKSTLIKIIAGAQPPSGGRLVMEGREVAFAGPADAKAAGIETVYQDLSLCPNVDVVANFFMGRELVRRVAGLSWLRERAMEEETGKALRDLGSRFPSLRARVDTLSGGQRQAIELARFVHWGGRLVLLDEPFAALGRDPDPARPRADRAGQAARRGGDRHHPQRPARARGRRPDGGPAPGPGRGRPRPARDQPRGSGGPDHDRRQYACAA